MEGARARGSIGCAMTDRFKVWQCIGCGRIEGEQPCIGICEDRPAELVYASEYDRALKRGDEARRRIDLVEGFLRRLASTTPSAGGWERSYRHFQDDARRLLDITAARRPPSESR